MTCITHCLKDVTSNVWLTQDVLSSYTFRYWAEHFRLALSMEDTVLLIAPLVNFVVEICQSRERSYWPDQGPIAHLTNSAEDGRLVGLNPCLMVVQFDLMELYPHVQHLHKLSPSHKSNALHIAARTGNECAVDLLMDPDTQPHISTIANARDYRGYTPLMVACDRGHTRVVQRLLRYPSLDLHAADNYMGATAMHLACKDGHFDVVHALFSRSSHTPVNMHIANSQDGTGLPSAPRRRLEIVEQLLAHRPQPPYSLNTSDTLGRTPLHYASWSDGDRLDIVQALLHSSNQPPVDLNAQDNHGHTALHDASARGNVAIVKELLGRGAALNARGGDGKTALMLAQENSEAEVESFLLSLPDIDLSGYIAA